jgi:hypothetical protein
VPRRLREDGFYPSNSLCQNTSTKFIHEPNFIVLLEGEGKKIRYIYGEIYQSMENNNASKLSKWLEFLQQESWQLELVISGFAIFLVGSLGDPLNVLGNRMEVASSGFTNISFLIIPLGVLNGAWFFLLINLILHIILRGLWISTIGLRYVSGGIDWKELNLHPKFERFLQSKIGSYDEYIE